MPLNFNSKQLSLVVEDVSGTTPAGRVEFPDALSDPLNAVLEVEDASMEPDIEFEEDNSNTASITPGLQTPGRKRVNLNYTTKLRGTRGGTFAEGAPASMLALKSCMFTVKAGGYFTLSGAFVSATEGETNAPFRHGELVRGNTGQFARVVHDTHDGATRLYFVDKTAAFPDGAVLVGLSSGAACIMGTTVDDAHYSAWPISKPQKSITVTALTAGQAAELTVGAIIKGQVTKATGTIVVAAENGDTELIFEPAGGQFNDSEDLDKVGPGTAFASVATATADPVFIQGQTVSARLNEDGLETSGVGFSGDVTLSAEVSKPWTLEFNLTGGFSTTGDLPLITGIDFENTIPPTWEDAETSWGSNFDATTDGIDDEVTICVSEMTASMGNTASERLCANAPGGVAGSRVTSREGTFTINPEATPEAEYPWYEHLFSGKPNRFRTGVGSDEGNAFVASFCGVQTTSIPKSDSDGVMGLDVQANLTGGSNWNLNGADVGIDSKGGDNEMVLTYLCIPA